MAEPFSIITRPSTPSRCLQIGAIWAFAYFGNNNAAINNGDNLSAFAGPGNDNTVVVP